MHAAFDCSGGLCVTYVSKPIAALTDDGFSGYYFSLVLPDRLLLRRYA
jgi:hypothetical protein